MRLDWLKPELRMSPSPEAIVIGFYSLEVDRAKETPPPPLPPE